MRPSVIIRSVAYSTTLVCSAIVHAALGTPPPESYAKNSETKSHDRVCAFILESLEHSLKAADQKSSSLEAAILALPQKNWIGFKINNAQKIAEMIWNHLGLTFDTKSQQTFRESYEHAQILVSENSYATIESEMTSSSKGSVTVMLPSNFLKTELEYSARMSGAMQTVFDAMLRQHQRAEQMLALRRRLEQYRKIGRQTLSERRAVLRYERSVEFVGPHLPSRSLTTLDRSYENYARSLIAVATEFYFFKALGHQKIQDLIRLVGHHPSLNSKDKQSYLIKLSFIEGASAPRSTDIIDPFKSKTPTLNDYLEMLESQQLFGLKQFEQIVD